MNTFPPSNNLSIEFFNTFFRDLDPLVSPSNSEISESRMIASILNFVASHLFTYFQNVVEFSFKEIDDGVILEDAVKKAFLDS